MEYMFVLCGLLVMASAILAALGYRGRPQVVGIDLGTTFSVVALKSNDGEISIIPDHITGKQLLPSVVSHLDESKFFDSFVVGEKARARRGQFPAQTIFNAKRFIGRNLNEVSKEASEAPYRVTANFTRNSSEPAASAPDALAGFAISLSGGREKWFSPIDIAAEVVRHMRRSISSHLGFDIKRAVICVPAKFTVRETKATQQAFEQAGFKVMRVLEEPTAAAVAYNLHKKGGVRYVLVYDIGGGTLDTSLLFMNGKAVSVLGVAGDDHLGGSDFDAQMRLLLESKVASALVSSEQLAEETCDSIGLSILAESTKIILSNELRTEVRCRDESGKDRILSVTRTEFEEAAGELFGRAMAPVQKVLDDQMMTAGFVDDIVLVGGASRTPKLRQLLKEFFGETKELHSEIDPDITVAWGAASILD